MKKSIAMLAGMLFMATMTMTAVAKENSATVTFGSGEEILYAGEYAEEGTVIKLGSFLDDVPTGEIGTETVALVNNSETPADFYLNIEAIMQLRTAAERAGEDCVVTVKLDGELLWKNTKDGQQSTWNLETPQVDGALKGMVHVAEVAAHETKYLEISVSEGEWNGTASEAEIYFLITYTPVGAKDTVIRTVTNSSKRSVIGDTMTEILDEDTPLSADMTDRGDRSRIILCIAVLAAGGVVCFVVARKQREEDIA